VPQAMVTGTSSGTDSVKDTGSARIARTAARARRKAKASAAACPAGILEGLATKPPSMTDLPSVRRVSAGTSGRVAAPASCAAVKTALA
jgi:hypothetical protein